MICLQSGAEFDIQQRNQHSTENRLFAAMYSTFGRDRLFAAYVDNSGICPVCGTNFFSRARVLTHVYETKIRNETGQQTCRQKLLAGCCPALSESILGPAATATRKERREAQRHGRTHVPATVRAKRRQDEAQTTVFANLSCGLRPLKRLRTKTAQADIVFASSEGVPKRRRLESQIC